MDFFGFTLSVWASIAFGVFFLAMVVACTADRNHREGGKWWVLAFGLVGLVIWKWNDLSWGFFTSASFWKPVGIYIGIGLAYATIEFWFKIRREARAWKNTWEQYKRNQQQGGVHYSQQPPAASLEEGFVNNYSNSLRSDSIVLVKLDAQGNIEPTVNRSELAQSIGCWTAFWPAYAFSLLLGDLLTEVCRQIANLFAVLSKGFVRRAFAGVFVR